MTPILPPHNPPSATFDSAGVHALEPSGDARALRRRFPKFMMFGDNAQELTAGTRWLGFSFKQRVAKTKTLPDHVRVKRGEIKERGEHDVEGLFMRRRHAIHSTGAQRAVLDSVETIFAELPDHAVLRAELRRLFRWLKDAGMVVIIAGEKGTTPA